ncbi:putative aldolase LsrF [compost metagenome]
MVKVNYTGDKKSFEKIINSVNIPVVIAGGDFHKDGFQMLQTIRDAIDVGASGVAIGRNIFQSKQMEQIVECIDMIVNYGAKPEEVF